MRIKSKSVITITLFQQRLCFYESEVFITKIDFKFQIGQILLNTTQKNNFFFLSSIFPKSNTWPPSCNGLRFLQISEVRPHSVRPPTNASAPAVASCAYSQSVTFDYHPSHANCTCISNSVVCKAMVHEPSRRVTASLNTTLSPLKRKVTANISAELGVGQMLRKDWEKA